MPLCPRHIMQTTLVILILLIVANTNFDIRFHDSIVLIQAGGFLEKGLLLEEIRYMHTSTADLTANKILELGSSGKTQLYSILLLICYVSHSHRPLI